MFESGVGLYSDQAVVVAETCKPYEPLNPYWMTVRHRLEIGGPWERSSGDARQAAYCSGSL